MTRILGIETKVDKVFDIFKNITPRHLNVNLAETGQKGVLEPMLQHNIPQEPARFPEVWLDKETGNK